VSEATKLFLSPPSPRKDKFFFSDIFIVISIQCVAVDAVVEVELVSALQVSVFPEIIFTKAGKILYREKGNF
jgi:uncharacterized membrane protein YobD (UPF0266 family)